jgi:acetyl esterase
VEGQSARDHEGFLDQAGDFAGGSQVNRRTFLCLVAALAASVHGETNTPTSFPDAQTYIYRDLKPEPLRLFVVKPDGWQTGDRRPAMIYFFGGAWTRGDPSKSIGWARMVAKWGMVGIAPDYRTAERFETTPVEATADARAAMRWVEDHATDLGVDTNRIVVAGTSAGGHLALWTAIAEAPFGSKTEESPATKPAVLVLISAPADTTPSTWNNDPKMLKRFGPHIGDVSPLQHLDAKMPPVIMFHGDADPTVPYVTAVALHDKLIATSNICVFITIPGGGHGIGSGWKDKSRAMIKEFLTKQKILPAAGK